ncbi:Rne/Rng family ribonuclease, partial [Rothia sp. AR01]
MNHETEGSTESTTTDPVETTPGTGASQSAEPREEATAGSPLAPSVLFQAPDLEQIKAVSPPKRQEREPAEEEAGDEVVSKRRRKRRRGTDDVEVSGGEEGDPPNTVTKVRAPRTTEAPPSDKVASVKGSTRLEAKRQRRRESRASGRRRHVITEAEFLARRESVERQMMVRQKDERIQIGVLEDGVLAEHFVSETQQDSLIGNVYLGKVQNVLPSMEAAFVDIGRGRNAVLYAGEVNWDASGLDGQPRKIENALKSGDSVLVQVTKDPVGHKGARLTSQVSLPGRFLVYVPGGSMTGISRKLPDTERNRLKKILKDKLPDGAGVIVRTAAEGAAEEELAHDVNRLRAQWEEIESRSSSSKVLAPELLYQEPDLTIKTVRDVFNEDFSSMVVQGEEAWDSIEAYVTYVAPDLVGRLEKWEDEEDLFDHYRIEEGLAKALERKVFLPSGGSLVIDRTEAMTVIDVNTGKFTGSGGNLEETVTKNNLEAAEEIVRQLRLRDIGGIIVIDFIDMVLESNRDLVLRRLVECLGRDRTKHQVAEVTSLGLVQMTRKRMGTGLLEVFSEPCEHCAGRGIVVQDQPIKGRTGGFAVEHSPRGERNDRKRGRGNRGQQAKGGGEQRPQQDDARAEATRNAVATIAAASKHADEAEDAPGEQTGGQHPEAHRPEDGESRSAKKRKRRKRNKGRQEGFQEEARGPESERSERGGPDLVLNLHGEVISLPQGHAEDEEEPEGEQGAFTLESLSEAFERRGGDSGRRTQEPVAAETEAEQGEGREAEQGQDRGSGQGEDRESGRRDRSDGGSEASSGAPARDAGRAG